MNSNIEKAREIMVQIVVEIDRICKKYDLSYWLDSGTLLGAVRHRGFIPWDDDIDIGMRIEDYNKFCEIAKDELPKTMFLQTSKTDKNFPLDFAKIRDNRGQIIERKRRLSRKKNIYNMGIFVDIFPIITIKNRFVSKEIFIFLQLAAKFFGYGYMNIPHVRKFIVGIHDRQHMGWKKPNINIVRSALAPWPNELYIDKTTVFPLKKMEFEKHMFNVPNNTHDYLVSMYGRDYMKLPPEKNRVVHALNIEIFE